MASKQMHFLDAETVISARLPRAWAAVSRRIAELEAVVEKLPKTADGKPVVGDTTLWFNGMGGPSAVTTRIAADFGESAIGPTPIIMRSYSTRQAALAAQEARNAK